MEVAQMCAVHQNLADLQGQSLARIARLAAVLGWVALVGLSSVHESGAPLSPAAWAGSGLLLLGAGSSLALGRRHLHLGSYLLLCGAFGACLCALLAFPAAAGLYLLILPITFASILLDQLAFLCVTVLALFSALFVSLTHMGERLHLASLLSPAADAVSTISIGGLVIPMAVVILVAATLWLSAHSLRTALTWVWSGYERARHNEEIARNRQAELKRALKALDEASYRLERVNHMLVLACNQAEEARRLKQQFAQTISHELRTPLNLIVGFTELMAQSPEYYGHPLAPAYLRDLGIVYRNACYLRSLVNDVLDLARVEAAQMSLVPEEVDPTSLVQEAVNTARSLVEARGLTLHTVVEPDLPRLWIDPTRIRQVLFNLLNNAARFTERGSVTLRVCRKDDAVLFSVADTGIGIAPEDIPHVFDEFHQVDGGTRRQHGGSGLGLAISRKFVELHGGQIWVESRVGQGSTFSFRLPIHGAHLEFDSGQHGVQLPRATPLAKDESILLAVTRSPAGAALLSSYIRGFRTVAVADLEEAHHMARQLMPQVVVIDRLCAELDQKALQNLAQVWGLPHTPFITCPLPGALGTCAPLSTRKRPADTASAPRALAPEETQQVMAVDGYLVKPVSRQGLWDLLHQFGKNVDHVLVVDDDEDFVLFLSRILEDSPLRRYQVVSAGTGQEVLALLDRRPPDLVLLDLKLPDIDGLELIERIRSHPAWQRIPIIIVSAQDEIDYRASLPGAMAVARVGGLMPTEVVQWVQHIADSTRQAVPAR